MAYDLPLFYKMTIMKPFFVYILSCIVLCMSFLSCNVSSNGSLDGNDVARVQKLIKRQDLRKPLPEFMKFDRLCMDCLYSIEKLDPMKLKMLADSALARHEENLFICQTVDDYKITEEAVLREVNNIKREELRYNEFVKQCAVVAERRACEKKSMPQGKLLNLYYRSQGMMFNPLMPLSFTTDKNGNIKLTYGYPERVMALDEKVMDDLAAIIQQEQLYKLHPSYCRLETDLPDVEKIRVLDEGSWSFNADFSDGTAIKSYGQGIEPSSVYKIFKYAIDSLDLKMER